MGLFGSKKQQVAVFEMPVGNIDIVGESHYQNALASIAGPKTEDGYCLAVTVELRRDPKNKYDKNAIECRINGKLVGHISRESTSRLQPLLQRLEKTKQKATVDGYIMGGWSRKGGKDQGDYGVKLDIK